MGNIVIVREIANQFLITYVDWVRKELGGYHTIINVCLYQGALWGQVVLEGVTHNVDNAGCDTWCLGGLAFSVEDTFTYDY